MEPKTLNSSNRRGLRYWAKVTCLIIILLMTGIVYLTLCENFTLKNRIYESKISSLEFRLDLEKINKLELEDKIKNYEKIISQKNDIANMLAESLAECVEYKTLSDKLEILKNNKTAKKELQFKDKSSECYKVTAYSYNLTKKQCGKDPSRTANMEYPIPGFSIAVSRDMKHLLGSIVFIEHLGLRYVNDVMGPNYKNSIDILAESQSFSKYFGKNKVTMMVVNDSKLLNDE